MPFYGTGSSKRKEMNKIIMYAKLLKSLFAGFYIMQMILCNGILYLIEEMLTPKRIIHEQYDPNVCWESGKSNPRLWQNQHFDTTGWVNHAQRKHSDY